MKHLVWQESNWIYNQILSLELNNLQWKGAPWPENNTKSTENK